ncbi:MAG: hypothetical protein ACTSW1_04765 [Candidatus Hodarchaeales archaeon]
MKRKKDIYEILAEITKEMTIDVILNTLQNEKTTRAQLIEFIMNNYSLKKTEKA